MHVTSDVPCVKVPEPAMTDTPRSATLVDPALRAALGRFIRSRVPDRDVEDLVQSTLTDAVAARSTPESQSELRKWVYGIAHHKIADYYREQPPMAGNEPAAEIDAAVATEPLGAKDLLRWAENELPSGESVNHTFDWLLREGDGEKLEHIAVEAQMPAAVVRQRVSRLRKYFRERWTAQLAAALVVLLAVIGATYLFTAKRKPEREIVRGVPSADTDPMRIARRVRKIALESCRKQEWRECLDGLDRAAGLDPNGDSKEEIRGARAKASEALRQILNPVPSTAPELSPPAPTVPLPSPTVAPSSTQPPPPRSTPTRAKSDSESYGTPLPSPKAPAPLPPK